MAVNNKIDQLVFNPVFVKKMVNADTQQAKNGQVTLKEMLKEFPTLGVAKIQKIFEKLWVNAGSQKTGNGEKYISLQWLQTQNLSQQIAVLNQQKETLIAKQPSRGGILTACANISPLVVNDSRKLTQTDFFVLVNTGGVKWNVNPASSPTSSTPPVLNIPNKFIPHAVDTGSLVRVWRLDASGNRIAGEVHTLSIDANKRIVDPLDPTGATAASYAASINANVDTSRGTYYKINYPEFTTAGPVYGVQYEMYYSTGPSNHPILQSAYSPAIMNPSAQINRNTNLDVAPLLLVEKPTTTSPNVTYYLGVKQSFALPAADESISISFGSETIKVKAGSLFDYSSVVTDDSYQYNGSAIKKIKFSGLTNFLNSYGGTVSINLPGYSNKITVKKTDIDKITNTFGTGSAANVNSATSSLNWNGVDNSALWTVTVQTEVSGAQYNEYTIPAATWTTLSGAYGIPTAQLRLLIVRGDGVSDPSTLATNYANIGGYDPGSPYATIAQYEAAGIDVPVIRTSGLDYATPTTGAAAGEGVEISPAGGTGPTAIRFKTSDSAINTIRKNNDGSLKVLVFRAGVANNGSNVFVHSLNLSVSSGEQAQWEKMITDIE
jgi:hypothetical protein